MTSSRIGTAVAAPASTGTASGAGRTSRRRSVGWVGLAPFAVYVVLFLAIPAVVAVGSGFLDADGRPTLANLATLGDRTIQLDFLGSFELSAGSAVISAILGAIVCWALSACRPDGLVRTMVDSASSVLAQFGGIMLAFAMIATVGAQTGVVTLLLHSAFGISLGPFLYSVGGLTLPYVYFGVPLMVLTFMPAVEGVKPQWGEAAATLGATRLRYWLRIGAPVLAPAFFGSVILLFANAFSSFATAAALIDQGGIVPLAIQQQETSETVVGVANSAGVLALGMVVVMAVMMTAYAALERRARLGPRRPVPHRRGAAGRPSRRGGQS